MNQALSILTQLGVNQTVFLMFGVVVVFFAVMNIIVFKPLTKILVERDERIDGRKAKAEAFAEEAQSLELNFATNIKSAHREAATEFAKLKAEALQKQAALLSKAREDAQNKIKIVRQEVAANVASEFSKISSEIPSLAALVMDRVLKNHGTNGSKSSAMNSEV